MSVPFSPLRGFFLQCAQNVLHYDNVVNSNFIHHHFVHFSVVKLLKLLRVENQTSTGLTKQMSITVSNDMFENLERFQAKDFE